MRYNTPELLLVGAAQTLVLTVTSEQDLCTLDNGIEPPFVSKDPGEW